MSAEIDDIDLENVHRAAKGLPPMTAQEIRDAEIRAGAEVLDSVRDFIGKYCVLPDHALVAVTLWAAHCHAIRWFHTTPRLALISPEPESGKTRTLEVLHLLVPEAELILNPSSASVFRKLAVGQITVLLDECDAIFKVHGKDDPREDLRAMLNSGYRIGATIPRCVGPKHEVINFPVFCPVAVAGIGDLPDTVMSRSIIIRIRRRAPHEHIEEFRLRQAEPVGHALRAQLARWGELIGEEAGNAWPELPEGVTDRKAECWEPLIAIAELAGTEWAHSARAACSALVKVATERKVSLGIRLLGDLRILFGEDQAMHTETILVRLCAGAQYGLDADAPWGELHGRPLGDRGLASMLKKYNVVPAKIRIDDRVLQGYRRADLWDAWERYLPPRSVGPVGAEQVEQPIVPDVPDVPPVQTPQGAPLNSEPCIDIPLPANGAANCRYCRHFKPGESPTSIGYCHFHAVETWPAPTDCKEFRAL